MTAKHMRESQIEKHLVQQVNTMGGQVRKVSWIGRNGAPDRRVMLPGKCFWIELKATGEVPTAAQMREHKRMSDMGEVVHVADSIEKVNEVLGV